MKVFKHMTAPVLALVMAAALAVTAYAATVTVKYREFVYSGQITFRQYDYSQSTSPTIVNMTISATSSLGSGSALYHVKYANGTVAYCIQPGVHSDDSGSYVQGSSGCWYNLPASVQSAIALALACGYPSADYGTASGDRNSSAIINAEKWAATQAIIWELICEYRSAYTYDDWGYSPFYDCVDTSRYPTFELWYDEIAAAMQSANEIPSFAAYAELWADVIELKKNAAGSYTASVTDTNGVLSAYNFTANSGNGVTFTRKGNTLTITATAAAAKNLLGEKTYSATGSAFEMDPDEAVLCWYDRTGRYQAMASYTGVGRDPLRVYIKIRAVEEKGSLTINKVDAETDEALAGVTYRLFDASGNKVADVTTGADGKAVFKDLPQGKYSYQEISAPSGYVVDSTKYQISITATVLNITQKRTNTPARASIEIVKVDGDNKTPLQGAGFRLYDASNKQVAEGYTDASGKLTFSGLRLDSYTYKEFKAPDGYVLDDTAYSAVLNKNGQVLKVTRENTPVKGSIEILKVDADTKQPLAGVVFRLFDANGSKIADGMEVWERLPDDLSMERRMVVTYALALVDKVDYFWGGKSLVLGWDDRWGELTEVTAEGSDSAGTEQPYGLDCSGFVDWAFYNASGGEYVIGQGGGAMEQHANCVDIEWDEVQPGDLLFYPEGEHVGIAAGRDWLGRLLVVHCAVGTDGVAISHRTGFETAARPVWYTDE